jgi:predicted nucleic acid-binding protein
MILLDSSVLIDLFRKKDKRKSFFFMLLDQEEHFAISSITHYEIGIGNKQSDSAYWKELYNNLTVIPFDENCSETDIDIYLNLKKKNKLIDIADLLIAATAVAHGLTLATLNKKHFVRIENLGLLYRNL